MRGWHDRQPLRLVFDREEFHFFEQHWRGDHRGGHAEHRASVVHHRLLACGEDVLEVADFDGAELAATHALFAAVGIDLEDGDGVTDCRAPGPCSAARSAAPEATATS